MNQTNAIFIILITIISCKVIPHKIKYQNMIHINPVFEKLDTALYWNRSSNPEWNEEKETFNKPNGNLIYITVDSNEGFEEIIYVSAPEFYKIRKTFYIDGFIKSKGLDMGAISREGGFGYGIKIGLWYYFDDKGKLTKTVNEDEKFGKFGYNELLHFLDKEHVINIRTGENREELKVFFDEIEKFWIVEVYNKVKAHIENGERDIDTKDGFGYKIDGHTGKVLYKRKQHYIQSMGRTEFEYIIKEPRKSIIL